MELIWKAVDTGELIGDTAYKATDGKHDLEFFVYPVVRNCRVVGWCYYATWKGKTFWEPDETYPLPDPERAKWAVEARIP